MCNFNVKFFSLFGGTAPRPHMLMGYGAHLQTTPLIYPRPTTAPPVRFSQKCPVVSTTSCVWRCIAVCMDVLQWSILSHLFDLSKVAHSRAWLRSVKSRTVAVPRMRAFITWSSDQRPRFESRVAPLFHWVATLGKLFTHTASPGYKKEFSAPKWLWWLSASLD